ncbi:tetratricopeptide repeat protein [Psychromonas sp. KJ10-10]|uniref:tetratricopeptide repeat protein n=1 Tax=Psychromonas sp. KJ10-10 TaxID=3391823 RepID=UPI0039B67612
MKNIICVVCILFTSVVLSADFNKGLDAADEGDFKTAYKEWHPLAEQGDSDAQFSLGVMYDNGRGVLQDYKQAVYWYRKSRRTGGCRCAIQFRNYVQQWVGCTPRL